MDMAYKHISVCWADHHVQVVEFRRRYFMPASLLITLAEETTGFPHSQSLMRLDDNCCVDGKGSVRLRAYREAYRTLVEEVGVRLAGEDNPSKAFPPSTKGEILGLIYDGEAWTWEIPKDKLDRMFHS